MTLFIYSNGALVDPTFAEWDECKEFFTFLSSLPEEM